MSTIDATNIIVGNSPTQSQNLKITGNNDGTFTIGRADGSQTIMTVDESGLITQTQGKQLTLATAKAYNWNGLTTNTFLDFETIPSWVKRITVMLNGNSLSGTSFPLVQLGAGSIDTASYVSYSCRAGNGVASTGQTSTAGYIMDAGGNATYLWYGTLTLIHIGSNVWVSSHSFGNFAGASFAGSGGGNKTLSGTLDRIRLTTVNGTDTFDAGSVNIMYEG